VPGMAALAPATIALALSSALVGPAPSGGPGASTAGAAPVELAAASTPVPRPPAAWVLVDADTGNVLSARDDHVPLPPASVSKLLTAIIAVEDLPPNAPIPVSPVAQGMEAETMSMKAGQVWPLDDVLHAALIVSANDAAVALAEKVSGSRQAFVAEMDRWANILGLVDHPALEDPAGLDDSFSYGGGNRISAYDLAIIGRAALAIGEIRTIVGLRNYSFLGPDGVVHHLINHDQILETYPGALGLKTGYTGLAGNTFVGAATLGGRTMLVVELNAPDMYVTASALLDQGFATPVGAESDVDRLPPVRLAPPPPAPTPASRSALTTRSSPAKMATGSRSSNGSSGMPWPLLAVSAAVVTGGLWALRARTSRRRMHRRRATRQSRALSRR
jgi:D-alanyl-D-alanine carboxypeptidase (penicillin-binding protein 5/6)